MHCLDDPNSYATIDPKGMAGLIMGLPEQCQRAWEIGMAVDIKDIRKPNNIVLVGMGGSGIAGDLLCTLLSGELPIPMAVVRDYTLPAFAGAGTLVIASSYSGNTEEVLAAYGVAHERGAQVLVITSGGELERLAKEHSEPLITIPEKGLMPRAMVGYSFFPILAVLQLLGLVSDKSHDIEEMLGVMDGIREGMGPDNPMGTTPGKNPAKDLAVAIHGKTPVVHGAGVLMSAVAMRWKGQFNENGKSVAYFNTYPELDHNEIVGWNSPPEALDRTIIIELADSGGNPRISERVRITTALAREAGLEVHVVETLGESPLSRMFSLICQGDFVSLYLALTYGNDPTPVSRIESLKAELAKE